jgi:hypothetical protein
LISKRNLRILAKRRLRDSFVLYANRRYDASVYLGGYCIEFLLKLQICNFFSFTRGFPETQLELNVYSRKIRKTFEDNVKLRNFKTHELENLLVYSGREIEIKNEYLTERTRILNWNPRNRYLNLKVTSEEAGLFYNDIFKLFNFLIKN